MKKCKCGGEWGDNANFCGYCGGQLSDSEQSPEELQKIEAINEGPPSMEKTVDIAPLRELIASYVKEIEAGEYHEDSDWDHYIYEKAVSIFFPGDSFWEWFNKIN